LRRLIERGGDQELCRTMLTEASMPIPANFEWNLCPAPFQARIAAREGTVSWKSGARPTECGTSCVGRISMTRSTALDRPNTIFAMLYGHLDFAIDVPGPTNRSVRFGYEAQFRCIMPPGQPRGNLEIRIVFGRPVVGDAGAFENILNFLVPINLSRAIEAGIQSRLSTPGAGGDTLDRCSTIGAQRLANAVEDQVLYNTASASIGRGAAGRVGEAAVRRNATVRFLRVTRKPPVFGFIAPADPGTFQVYLNGVPAVFPTTAVPALPAAGSTVAVNLCRTIDLDAADRLQLIFANSLGGATWSQFVPARNFGAGSLRRMTTGRTVVVPGRSTPDPTTGRPRPARPQQLVLREFELEYTIEYRPRGDEVVVGSTPPTRGGGASAGGAGRATELERDAGSSGATQACRQI
jgi:hypothetical protein